MNPSPLADNLRRNAGWMLVSRILRTALAAVYFALLARSLGVSGYGAFMGICALASILSPFASVGTGNLLVQHVSRDHGAFPERWGMCLGASVGSGVVLSAVMVILVRIALPHSAPILVVLWIAIAELVFARLLDLAGMAFQAVEQLSMMAWFSLALTTCRCVCAAGLLLFAPHATAQTWSWLYLVSTTVPACGSLLIVHRRLGLPIFRRFQTIAEFREGLSFSISLSAQTIYNDIDKTMLARIVGIASAGIYAAAYRIVDAAFSPVNALMCAAYAKFFQHGQRGLRDASHFGLRMMWRSALYSLVVGVIVWITAPLVPSVLGSQFAESVGALRLLSPLLLLRSVHVFAADSLTGAGYQNTRTSLQVVVAIANVVLNLVLLPLCSWRGACYATLLCDGGLALLLWSAVGVLRVRESRSRQFTSGCAVTHA